MDRKELSPENKEPRPTQRDQLVQLSADVYNQLQNFNIRADEPSTVENYIKNLEEKVNNLLALENQITESGASLPQTDYRPASELKDLLVYALLHCLNTDVDGSSRIEAVKVKLDQWENFFIILRHCLDLEANPKATIEDINNVLSFEQLIKDALTRLDALPAKDLTVGQPDEREVLMQRFEDQLARLSEQRQTYEQSLDLNPEQIADYHKILAKLEKQRGIVDYNFHSLALADHQITLKQLNYIDSLLTSIINKGEELLKAGYYHASELVKLQQEVNKGRAKIAELRERLDSQLPRFNPPD